MIHINLLKALISQTILQGNILIGKTNFWADPWRRTFEEKHISFGRYQTAVASNFAMFINNERTDFTDIDTAVTVFLDFVGHYRAYELFLTSCETMR